MAGHKNQFSAVGGPIFTRAFLVLAGIFAIGLLLTAWRSVVGLGPATGLNDGYTWGMWKNFNTIVLTAVGSGGYAMALLIYVLNQGRFAQLGRLALVTSLLAYTTGIIALTVDLGRPWNFWRLGFVNGWNLQSVLLEVAVCMTVYLAFLYAENIHPLFEKWHGSDDPKQRALAERWEPIYEKAYPWIVGAAIVLPSMHQSSLGSLFMLAGPRLHPIWQTPTLPLFYVVAANFLGYACVVLAALGSEMVWKRKFDATVLSKLSGIMSWVLIGWLLLRFIDINIRGVWTEILMPSRYSLAFWLEIVLLAIPAIRLRDVAVRHNKQELFRMAFLVLVGGCLYRFNPTTIGFMPGPQWSYFPSVTEILITLAYPAMGWLAYLVIVKRFAILPAPAAATAKK